MPAEVARPLGRRTVRKLGHVPARPGPRRPEGHCADLFGRQDAGLLQVYKKAGEEYARTLGRHLRE
eukprot:11630787-Alexandrium_andersonii.AAC.1